MRILLHICCAPCALMPVRELRAQGHELMGLWYNPNVHPYTENQKRLDTLKAWAEDAELRLIVQDDYPLEKWLRRTAHREAVRCGLCYHDRLLRAAQVAKKGRFGRLYLQPALFGAAKARVDSQDRGRCGGRKGGQVPLSGFQALLERGHNSKPGAQTLPPGLLRVRVFRKGTLPGAGRQIMRARVCD